MEEFFDNLELALAYVAEQALDAFKIHDEDGELIATNMPGHSYEY